MIFPSRVKIRWVVFMSLLFLCFFYCHTNGGSGLCSSAKSSPYVLPYPVGDSYRCFQGYPPFNHDSLFQYAVDFEMPIGSLITAARAGVVEFVENGFLDSDTQLARGNLVIIRHEDGTFARYVHLTHNGGLVQREQRVERGDPIARSGSSGSFWNGAPLPHLHFDVTDTCPQATCQTIPVCFRNTQPHPDGLQTGVVYRAESY
jgi:murein DD-endopeptidase MepM/ murein hydrolase activator NlpD